MRSCLDKNLIRIASHPIVIASDPVALSKLKKISTIRYERFGDLLESAQNVATGVTLRKKREGSYHRKNLTTLYPDLKNNPECLDEMMQTSLFYMNLDKPQGKTDTEQKLKDSVAKIAEETSETGSGAMDTSLDGFEKGFSPPIASDTKFTLHKGRPIALSSMPMTPRSRSVYDKDQEAKNKKFGITITLEVPTVVYRHTFSYYYFSPLSSCTCRDYECLLSHQSILTTSLTTKTRNFSNVRKKNRCLLIKFQLPLKFSAFSLL
jgi:hypothetical protein